MADDQAFRGCVQRAYLYLARDVEVGEPPYTEDELRRLEFEPEAVTRLVGLQPTRSWRRGDPHPRWPKPRRFSHWSYDMAEVRTYETDEVVVSLLDVIEPYGAGIAEACRVLGLRAGITVVITMTGDPVSTAAICYHASILQRLVALGLSLDHDQYGDATE